MTLGKTVTGTTATGTNLPCMSEGCERIALVWITKDKEAGVDRNGQSHGSRRVNMHVCGNCRDELRERGWRIKTWRLGRW